MLVRLLPRKLLIAIVASASIVACSDANDQRTYAGMDIDWEERATAQPLPCENGAVQSCTIFLGRHGDLANCVKGVDICSDGGWTGCIAEAALADNPQLYAELAGE